MKALRVARTDVTRERLLALAEESPGAWLGLRIAIMILFLDGYRPTFLAELFGVSRMTLTRWVHRVNRQGLAGLPAKPRAGRSTQLTSRLRRQLSEHLKQSPERYLWAAAGSVGWPHTGVSFAPTLRRGVEGPAGTVLVAPFGL